MKGDFAGGMIVNFLLIFAGLFLVIWYADSQGVYTLPELMEIAKSDLKKSTSALNGLVVFILAQPLVFFAAWLLNKKLPVLIERIKKTETE